MKVLSIQILAVSTPACCFLQQGRYSTFFKIYEPISSRKNCNRTLENNYTTHACIKPVENLIGIIITNDEYPVRVAFSLLNKLSDEFTTKISESRWKPILANPPTSGTAPNLRFNSINKYLVKYQDPQQANTILKGQQELDETKIVLHKTIESVLERGEKLDS
ncbi:hypothetical protein MJO29_005209 [Puccinia striiformis f. sp. tritici]|nr:hypothetical protein MJO29_005209 [Puccinia striiformis f. sp. tritici]